MATDIIPYCEMCVHRKNNGCEAFKKIPDEIYQDGSHTSIRDDQTGEFVFVPRNEKHFEIWQRLMKGK